MLDSCHALAETLRRTLWDGEPLRVQVDTRDLNGGVKKWEWIKKGVPIRIEVGPRDLETRKVCVQRRDHATGAKEFVSREDFLRNAPELLAEIQASLLARATALRDANIIECTSLAEFEANFAEDGSGRWLLVPWDGSDAEEEELSKRLRITIRCLPYDQAGGEIRGYAEAPCVLTGRPTTRRALWARSY